MTPTRWRQLESGLRQYVIDAWMAGQSTTINGAAAHLGELRPVGDDLSAASTPVYTLFEHMERDGIAVRDVELSSKKTRVIMAWNWSGLPLDGQSLGTALEGYLAAPEKDSSATDDSAAVVLPDGRTRQLSVVGQAERYLVMSAVRALVRSRFGPEACGPKGPSGLAMLLAACSRIPAIEITSLPGAAKAAGTQTSGERYHSAINILRRYAAVHDLIAMYVPAPMHAHPWAHWADGAGVSASNRSTLYRLYDVLRGENGNGVPTTPDRISIVAANAAIEKIRSTTGPGSGRRTARDLRSLLVSLGLSGHGPYQRLQSNCALLRTGTRHVTPRWMLATSSLPQSWASTAALLASEGFPPDWQSFYLWYAEYSTRPIDELQHRWGDAFSRAPGRVLKPGTSRQRHAALRVWLGVAHHELKIPLVDCTPARVMGTDFPKVMAALKQAWRRRAGEQQELEELGLKVPGHAIVADSPSLVRHIANAGLIAEALATWSACRSVDGATDHTPLMREEWRNAYLYARQQVDELGGLRGRRIQKDVGAIVRDVSPMALIARSNERALSLIRSKPTALDSAKAVQRAIIGAVIGTGAVRAGELVGLTYGASLRHQVGQAAGRTFTRYLSIPGWIRKTDVDHEVPLPEEFVPLALWDWHRTSGRTLLMAAWLRLGYEPHDFIFCSPKFGGPFGSMPQSEAGASDDAEGIARCSANGAGAISSQYEKWRRRELSLSNWETVEGGRGHHSAHSARSQSVRALQEVGLGPRAAYLLGHKNVDPTAAMYGASVAETNADTLRRVLRSAPWLRGATADVSAPQTIEGLRRRTHEERQLLERQATLGREMEEVLAQVADMSPNQAYRRLMELAEERGRPAG